MFKLFKNILKSFNRTIGGLLGSTSKTQPLVLTDPIETPSNVTPLRPTDSTETKSKKYTKAALGKLTKLKIDAIAKEEFGIDLDRRKTKDAMIADLLAAQKSK